MSAAPNDPQRRPGAEDEAAQEAAAEADEGYPNPQGDLALDEEDAAQEAQETPGMG